MRRASVVAAAVLAAIALAVAPAPRASAAAGAPQLDAESWLLIDADDGERLASSGPSRALAIASATKLMTAYVALQELPLDKRLPAPAYQALPAESILGLREGERASVRDLLYSLILGSANDSAVTLAEGVSGSVRAFVDDMNAAAEQLGLDDTGFTNPIGFDAPGNRSSARDLAALSERLMEKKVFRRIADSTEATIETDQRTIHVPTRNTLLLDDPTVTGIKTGHTLEAGYVLVGSATRGDVDLISVVLGAPSEAARDSETAELLDYGFSQYEPRTPVREDETLAEPALADQDDTLPLVADGRLRVSVRDDQVVASELDAPDEVVGPVERGARLGSVTVTVDGREVGSVPLVAARGAEAATLSEKLRSNFVDPAVLIVIGVGVILVALLLARRRRGAAPRTSEERMRSREQRTHRREREGGPS